VTVTPANSISGPAGIIASGERAAIVGTYQDPSLLITGTVQDGAFRESDRIHLQAQDGAPLPMARVHCRTWRISGRSALAGHHLQVFRQPRVIGDMISYQNDGKYSTADPWRRSDPQPDQFA